MSQEIQKGGIYDFHDMEVRVIRIEEDYVVFEETAQSAPLLGAPLHEFQAVAIKKDKQP